ncbi:MAG: hypothetical protein AAGU11_02150 [Syntrophobacteraceae bacterium]
MPLRWRDGEIDNLLMEELASDSPSELQIRELVAQGADVCAVDDAGESMLMEAIDLIEGLDERYIYLLVELGAEANYATPERVYGTN